MSSRNSFLWTSMLLLILVVSCFAACLFASIANVKADAGWLDGWSYRRQLTINSGLIDETLTDFPVLVVLDSSFFDFTKAEDNGEDIRFTSSDGTTLLKYEIERWDKAVGKAEIWVKIPQVSASSDTAFYMYYGNPEASDAQDPANVWDSYAMVLHMKEASGTRQDSTANNNDGTPNAVTKAPSERIDGADSFDGSTSYINVPDANSLNFGTASFSYSFWFYSKAGTTQDIIDKKGGTATSINAGYKLVISSDANLGFSAVLGDGTNNVRLDTGPDSRRAGNVWAHFAVVVNRTSQTMTIYIDGAYKVSASISSVGSVTNTNPLRLGSQTPSGGRYFNGYLDEVRIHNVARSAAWIKASYYSEKNTLLTYGSEESTVPVFSNIGTSTTRAGALCEFHVKWFDSDGLDKCIFSTNNTGTWQNQSVTVSGMESWANVTLILNSVPGVPVGYRWYCNDTLGNMGDTGVRTLVTTGDWQYAMKIWFNNKGVTEDLVDFPVLINLTRAGADFWSYVGQTSKDLRFVDSDCATDLYFEVEHWDYAKQEAYVWVRVPKIDAESASDFIYVYYGNPSPPEWPYNNPGKVWENNYVMVHHLEESSGTHFDSTSNGNDGLPQGGVSQGVQGKIDGADTLDGVNDYVNCGNKASLTVTSMTIEAWVNRQGSGVATTTGSGGFSGEPIIAKGRAYQDTLGLNVNYFLGVVQTNNTVGFDFEDNSTGANHPLLSNTAIQNGQWYYVVATYDGTTSKIYINGILDNSLTVSKTPDYNPWAATIGSAISDEGGTNTPKGFFKGTIDEARISKVARTEQWIKAQYLSMNDQYITFGSQQTPNHPPNKPVNPSPQNGAVGVPTSTTLSVSVSDPDGDNMNVSFYQFTPQKEVVNFTLVVLPDTQFYSESYPNIFSNQTRWIAENAEALNIVFVTHEGDIVNQDEAAQWINANNSMSILDEADVPFGLAVGNHDVLSGNTVNFNTYFGYERFKDESWYGGAYNNNNTNSYSHFSNGDNEFLIFHFQYRVTSAVLNWANNTLAGYPNARVIVTMHNYMDTSGTRSTDGNLVWNSFIEPHANQVFLVLCGHNSGEYMKVDTVNGNKVYQLLANYQNRGYGGNGWLRILDFRPAEDKIYVKTYSPYLNQYETDANSQFTLDYDMTGVTASPPVLIGVDTDVPSGETASILWTRLETETIYHWFAVANDRKGGTTQSDTWSFTTTNKLAFDFGTLTSPLEDSYIQVTPSTLYSASLGYGWSSTTGLDCRDRGAPDNLKRDLVFSPTEHTFNIDLQNGDYKVTVVIGDWNFMHDKIDVYVENTLVIDNLTAAAGTFQQTDFYITISDGQLNLRIVDDGGVDPNWVINALTIEPGSPPTPPNEAKFDFGTSESPVEDDYIQVTESTAYSASLGYGWASTAGLASRDRGAPDNLKRDFVFGPAENTFNIDLLNGEYEVILTVGDQSYMHDLMEIYAEGTLKINDLTVPFGTFQEVSFRITVTDGQLNLRIMDGGGADPNWVLNAVAVKHVS